MRHMLRYAAFAALSVAACQTQAGDPAAEEDAAQPVDLVEIMQQMEVDMERVAHGVWVADFDSIAAAARAVADHPKVGPAERAEIMAILGEQGASFARADREVHDAAMEVAERARASDMTGVVAALERLTAGCMACHTGFRPTIQAARGPSESRTGS